MKFKGISEVIATLLMLIITIALAGTAYLYISGFFKSKTAVVLTIDEGFSTCNATNITIAIRNDGTDVARDVRIYLYAPNGSVIPEGNFQDSSNKLDTIPAGGYNTKVAYKEPYGAGYYKVIASSAVARAEGVIFCAQ